jgi:HEAT repeat protein
MNPGPYFLFSAKDSKDFQWRLPKTLDDLRADVKVGLANSREWRRSLSIENRAERAQALARYLLKSTSPKGDKGTYRWAVRQPLASLGKDAVPALVQVLRTAPAGAKLDPAVLILYDIGRPGAQAIPDLVALLGKPDRVFTGYVLSALGSTGDPRAIPYLEKYVGGTDERLDRDAREALALHEKRQLEKAGENEQRGAE